MGRAKAWTMGGGEGCIRSPGMKLVEIERSVLGYLIWRPRAMSDSLTVLRVESLQSRQHQRIFEAMLEEAAVRALWRRRS